MDMLTQDGQRARLGCATRRLRGPPRRALAARRSDAMRLAATMHESSVVSMPQLAWIADSFAHVDCSPCMRRRTML